MNVTQHANPDTVAAYFRLSDAAEVFQIMLSKTDGHADRARVLWGLSCLDNAMAQVYGKAFGSELLPEESGRDMSESLAVSARLLALVAGAEQAIGEARPRTAGDTDLDAAATPALDRMVAMGHMDEQLRDELYAAVEPIVGGQAAEAIARLPLGR